MKITYKDVAKDLIVLNSIKNCNEGISIIKRILKGSLSHERREVIPLSSVNVSESFKDVNKALNTLLDLTCGKDSYLSAAIAVVDVLFMNHYKTQFAPMVRKVEPDPELILKGLDTFKFIIFYFYKNRLTDEEISDICAVSDMIGRMEIEIRGKPDAATITYVKHLIEDAVYTYDLEDEGLVHLINHIENLLKGS